MSTTYKLTIALEDGRHRALQLPAINAHEITCDVSRMSCRATSLCEVRCRYWTRSRHWPPLSPPSPLPPPSPLQRSRYAVLTTHTQLASWVWLERSARSGCPQLGDILNRLTSLLALEEGANAPRVPCVHSWGHIRKLRRFASVTISLHMVLVAVATAMYMLHI